MDLNAIIANEIKTIEKTRALCGDKKTPFNALDDADFSVVANSRAQYFKGKASSVKSAATKAKWTALANLWASAQ